MDRLGFLYDTTRCIGCRACQMACKEQNKLGTGEFFRRVETLQAPWRYFSGACNHCQHPACTAVCPTGAMYISEDGTVQHSDGLCVGCGRCVHHCPYGAPSLNKSTGYAQKCGACLPRRQAGRPPACAEACPTRALRFGPMAQLRQEGGASCDGLPFLPPADMTGPSLLIRAAAPSAAGSAVSQLPAGFSSQAGPSMVRRDTDERFLILGGGVAAVSAARAIRERNATASIRILSGESHAPYCRPMLSKGHLDSFSMDRYSIVDGAWLAANRISLELGRSVTALDTAGKTVTLESGEMLSFDKCIYALGARSFLPPIPGIDKAGVFPLRSHGDLLGVRRRMLTAKSAVVIGGGITGLEIAWEIKQSGLQVTVLDLAPMLMGRLLDAKSSQILRDRVEEAGVAVVTDIRVKAITGGKSAEGVLLESGTLFPAELVVLSTGFRANTAAAQAAGLAAGQAVAVNAAMETSCPGVYACGDCVDLRSASWMQSIRQGAVAGANAAGDSLVYEAIPEPAMVHTAGTSLLSIGDMGKQPGRTYHLVFGCLKAAEGRFFVNEKPLRRRDTFYAFSFSEQKTVGVTLIGDLGDMLFAQEAVQHQWAQEALLRKAAERGIQFYEE